MAKFISGKELVDAVDDIIFNAKSRLLIISPFIRLDSYFKKLFEKHKNNAEVEIIIGFGKNEENVSRSLNFEDFEFFKNFPNIGIVYIPNLHAKYYSNEKVGLVTSINLLDSSFKNNIEYGVLGESKLFGGADKFDLDAFGYSYNVLKEGYAVYARRPSFKKKLLGFAKNYVGSTTEWDCIEDLVYNQKFTQHNIFEFMDQQKFVDFQTEAKPVRDSNEEQYRVKKVREDSKDYDGGYCIRCRANLSHNPSRPYCRDCYQSWNQYQNYSYIENNCHSCGKEENSSMEKPECYSCYTS
jgi:hypothetical protein